MSHNTQIRIAGIGLGFLVLWAFFAGYRLGKSGADRWWQKYAHNLEDAIPCSSGAGCEISPEGVVKHIQVDNQYEKFVYELEDQQKPRLIPGAKDAFGQQKFFITIPIRNTCTLDQLSKTDMVCHVVSDSRLDALVSLGATVWTASEWAVRGR